MALLHWKGESLFAAEYEARFDASDGGFTATEGSLRLCCTGRESPIRRRVCSVTQNNRRRAHTATEGSRGLIVPEGRALSDAE